MKPSISIGDLKENYEVVDTIFAIDSHSAGFISNANPNKAFSGVKIQLLDICKKLKGDDVINCQFEYRNALGNGMVSKKQVLGIFCLWNCCKIQISPYFVKK